ncbi:MAG: peptidase T [Clostridia bacterium]|nr:peptidase T [Clostridia bacterium]
MDIVERFLSYVAFPTQSDENSSSSPTTEKQWALLRHLEQELRQIGIADVTLNEDGYLFAEIPATEDAAGPGGSEPPCVAFIAHVDTAAEAPDAPADPRVVAYEGGDIELGHGKALSPSRFPELNRYVGQRLIVTDGATLLGADDKAGVAEIVTAAENVIGSGRPHGAIELCFMPDEEVGLGARRCERSQFAAEFGYTVDGGRTGDYNFENFNAARANVTFTGIPVHPGTAKNKLINALTLAGLYDASLPDERPENTEGYEGFYHLLTLEGSSSGAVSSYLIRDHSREKFEQRKRVMEQKAAELNERIGHELVRIEISDTYYNMRGIMEQHPRVNELALEAYRACGVEPAVAPIRGGTDGAVLTFKGLPCPNLCTGGENFHSEYEYISVEALDKCREIIEYLMTHVQ